MRPLKAEARPGIMNPSLFCSASLSFVQPPRDIRYKGCERALGPTLAPERSEKNDVSSTPGNVE